ncbi:MAG: 2-oxo acid dehydrogenase subunit E2 [Actinobacteria bacterium]|nr:2-oxo acid dehydrogenase subunit E2 [Actinomycetota bacterium]
MADITMPQLGETVTEGTITRWAKQVGDRIEEDEVLFEVSTDKVDSEVPAPTSGFLAEILVAEGETVEVGVKLAVISEEAPSGNGAAAAPATDSAGEAPIEAAEAEQAGAPEEQATDQADGSAEPPEKQPQEEPQAPEAQAEEPSPQPPDAPASGGAAKSFSPVVRRLIAEHGLDPTQITGTGSGGRITRADVLAVVEGGGAKASTAPTAPSSTAPSPAAEEKAEPAPAPAAKVTPGQRDEAIPFSNIRKRTAEHMTRSLSTSAHTLVVIEVDFDNVERARVPIKEQFKAEEGVSLNYLPFIARAVIDAIREFPRVNASVGENELVVHHYVNLGVAVDLNFEGLIVPVVHDADAKRLRALAREIAELAGKARSKKLSADDISGGTFTITNAGGYGTLITGPIINQPQVAILSTDGVKMKPVAIAVGDDDWAVAVHPIGNLAISFDHRAYDGAYAAAFLANVREILETRDWQQEL